MFCITKFKLTIILMLYVFYCDIMVNLYTQSHGKPVRHVKWADARRGGRKVLTDGVVVVEGVTRCLSYYFLLSATSVQVLFILYCNGISPNRKLLMSYAQINDCYFEFKTIQQYNDSFILKNDIERNPFTYVQNVPIEYFSQMYNYGSVIFLDSQESLNDTRATNLKVFCFLGISGIT